jgi:hypothetical protein
MPTAKMLRRAAPTAGGASVNFSGQWKNQLGSVMDLTISGQSVTGTYSSPVSGGGGTVDGDLVGYVDGDLIAFTVNWTTPASLTAWTGQLVAEGGQDVIRTLWHLVMNIPDANEPTGLWQSTFAGADNFYRP